MALLSSSSLINSQVLTDIGNLLTTMTGWITTNPILTIFLTLSLAGVGLGFFKGLKRAI